MNTDNTPPEALEDAWVIGNDHITELVCERHAREYAEANGLVFEYPTFTEESPNGYAYAIFSGSDIESDSPSACAGYDLDTWCPAYLDTALTPDGEQYLRENYPATWWHLWGIEA
jgi:hypothetical protein